MTITVTGKTYEHRNRLKYLGGRYDSNEKHWRFERISKRDLEELKKMPGCFIVEDDEATPPPFIPDDNDDVGTDDAISLILSESDRPSHGTGKTIKYGDDPTYYNAFKDRNPTSFFGFSNLAKMLEFIEAIPQHKREGARDAGWESGDKWHGTADMQEAINLARNGWPKGSDNAAAVLEILTGQSALQRRRTYSVAGGSVSVGRLLAGNPAHMVKRPKSPGRRVLTLFIEGCTSASISADNLIARAAVIAAIVDILERHGYSCEIVSVTMQATFSNNPAAQTAVQLKQAGEKLNIDDLVFSLGHPSFLRRFIFACTCQADELRGIWRHQGKITQAFNKYHEPTNGQFYIGQLSNNPKGSLIEKAAAIFKSLKPENFPIEMKIGD